MKRSRSIPRWAALALAPFVWLVAIPLGHGVVPWALSLIGWRFGWRDGSPARWNLIGLAPVAVGVIVLVWLMLIGFAQAAKMLERVELDWSPKIFLKRGPYAYTRHPMYLAELALWFGWAIIFGSPAVLAGFSILLIAVYRLAPREEQDLEAKFGDEYREYMSEVPRWLSIR
jgi:protein-S-isoprenylcysteine O-methyltransferase Ste14